VPVQHRKRRQPGGDPGRAGRTGPAVPGGPVRHPAGPPAAGRPGL